jgi:hypothetical protein
MEPRFDRQDPAGHHTAEHPYRQAARPPGRVLPVLGWLAVLALLAAAGAGALYAIRFEHFVMADGGYVLRLNRFTGKACYLPAHPEWERVLEGRQALVDRCAP